MLYLILLFKALLDCLLGFFSLTDFLQSFISNLCFQLLNSLKSISGWHQMIVVDQFDEWLHFASLGNSLLSHSRGNFARIALDSSYKSMAERVYFGSIVVWFQDDSLAASIAATGDEGNFTGFQD
jgi:hypothetical protein